MHLTLSLPSTPQCITIIFLCAIFITMFTITIIATTTLLREGKRAAPLSPTTIRVLYSLQLEMDSTLPIKVAAQCRLWAEEKYVRYDTHNTMCLTLLHNAMMTVCPFNSIHSVSLLHNECVIFFLSYSSKQSEVPETQSDRY